MDPVLKAITEMVYRHRDYTINENLEVIVKGDGGVNFLVAWWSYTDLGDGRIEWQLQEQAGGSAACLEIASSD